MRLLVLAHAETERTREVVLGDRSPVRRGSDEAPAPLAVPAAPRRGRVVVGPEPACAGTAEAAGLAVDAVLPGLAGPDTGSWAGLPVVEVGERDPEGLARWLADVTAAPHGGESLADLVVRAGRALDEQPWPEPGGTAVVTPLVARALVVHAVRAPPEVLLRVDVAPGGQVELTRHHGRWRLRALRPPGR